MLTETFLNGQHVLLIPRGELKGSQTAELRVNHSQALLWGHWTTGQNGSALGKPTIEAP